MNATGLMLIVGFAILFLAIAAAVIAERVSR